MDSKKGLIKLVSFAIYRLRGKPGAPNAAIDVICGAEAARFDGEKVELLAGSCPFHTNQIARHQPLHRSGVAMLYGRRDMLEELQFWRLEAKRLNSHFAWADVEIDVGHIPTGVVGRSQLKDAGSRFLSLRRSSASLQLEVLAAFRDYVAAEGANPDVTMARVVQIATRPDLFSRLIVEDPDFRHLSVVVIPVADDPDSPTRTRQIAFVRAGSRITAVSQGTDGTQIFMPAWLTD